MAGAYPIEFRFIKSEPTTPEQDEIIRITPYMVGEKRKFMWRYLAENKKMSTQVCIIEDDFFLYEKLRHMAVLMSWDSDPYAQVQLLLPTSPSVLFRSSDFPDAIEKVIDAIRVDVRHWPVKMDTVDAAKMAVTGQETLKDLPGSFTRSGCCYTPQNKMRAGSDNESVGPPPLAPLRKSLSKYHSDFKDTKWINCVGSGYLNPEEDTESRWET
jgi:hypothetical protein